MGACAVRGWGRRIEVGQAPRSNHEREVLVNAMISAFLSRFATGFLIPLVKLPVPGWIAGAIVGLLVSLPDAVITRTYAPILGVGLVGGALIGWAAGRWVAPEAG